MLLYVTAVQGSRTPTFLGAMELLLVTGLLSALLLLLDFPARPEGEKVKAGGCGESRLLPGLAVRLVA